MNHYYVLCASLLIFLLLFNTPSLSFASCRVDGSDLIEKKEHFSRALSMISKSISIRANLVFCKLFERQSRSLDASNETTRSAHREEAEAEEEEANEEI